MDERNLFERNRGVFGPAVQQRIRQARVLVIGNGGIGGTEALALARAGVERFTLVDFDRFEPTNANRQMVADEATFGKLKSEATAQAIAAINPAARCTVLTSKVPVEELPDLVQGHDLVFPAADDFAYSILVFRVCRRAAIPAVLAVPSGFWFMVSVLQSDSPTLERLLGLPRDLGYEELSRLFNDRFYRLASFFYVLEGGWTKGYQREFVEHGAPLAQLAPVVWTAGSLAALEGLKLLSRLGRPVTAPRYYWGNGSGVRVQRLFGANLHTLMVAHRRTSYSLLHSPVGPLLRKAAWALWRAGE